VFYQAWNDSFSVSKDQLFPLHGIARQKPRIGPACRSKGM
jgi:hypothetical protein